MSNNPYNQAKTTGELTKQVASALIDRRLRLTTAESCTGGSSGGSAVRGSGYGRILRYWLNHL